MLSLSERLLSQLRAVFGRRSPLSTDSTAPSLGWIATPCYSGPERRAEERRSLRERRSAQPRAGMTWWNTGDRRAGAERRQLLTH